MALIHIIKQNILRISGVLSTSGEYSESKHKRHSLRMVSVFLDQKLIILTVNSIFPF